MTRVRLLVSSAALATLSAGAAASGPEDDIAAIRRAFRGSSADALLATLPEERKVHLDLEPVCERESLLGRDQVFYLFKAFFADHRTVSFAVHPEEREADQDSSDVRAEWVYETGEGQSRTVHLILTVARERKRWALTAIRTVRS